MYRLQDFSRRCLEVFRLPRVPIEISYSIGESNTSSLHLAWKPNFEGIAFCLVCDGTITAKVVLPLYAVGDKTIAGPQPPC